MEYGQAHDSPNEFEITQVIWIDAGLWIDLKRVIIVD
jgi:hypothetical protein